MPWKKVYKMLQMYFSSFSKSFLTRNSTLFNDILITFNKIEKEKNWKLGEKCPSFPCRTTQKLQWIIIIIYQEIDNSMKRRLSGFSVLKIIWILIAPSFRLIRCVKAFTVTITSSGDKWFWLVKKNLLWSQLTIFCGMRSLSCTRKLQAADAGLQSKWLTWSLYASLARDY